VLKAWNTVVETKGFEAKAAKLFSQEEIEEIKTMLARNPECGDVIPGAGGVRKVRVPASGRGKRGGARVIYYFLNDGAPIFLFTVFAKNEKDDLDKDDLANIAAMAAAIKAAIKAKGPTK
jgi:hypothetical protein